MSDPRLEPVIDWSKDDDVLAVGKQTDEDVLAKGWCDVKITGMSILLWKTHFLLFLIRN